ncbi:hypothetical protein AUJ95_06970 [Candidatus Desantisbacteria bacterium CG2_30_40_21]|uniref:UPF0434 protein AUJ95_06970 n=5 Tax=unclassified Candidatus Desantisiibacteriota TaxID=3106372 RepID=A0A1J5E2W9_9BACT|nr:MAG: hypothetical protein AUJ95_06970 [Candidatus Desantisbacteria bacterium CG2_30_40_21]
MMVQYFILIKFAKGETNNMINKELLDILACPECKGEIVYDEPNQRLICHNCKKKYPVRDGIPVMLVEEAEAM